MKQDLHLISTNQTPLPTFTLVLQFTTYVGRSITVAVAADPTVTSVAAEPAVAAVSAEPIVISVAAGPAVAPPPTGVDVSTVAALATGFGNAHGKPGLRIGGGRWQDA